MRNLLTFLFKYGYWLLFFLLEVISFVLLFRFNNYQGSIGFTSANRMVGTIYHWAAKTTSFFQLRTINEQLVHDNVKLQTENESLRKALHQVIPDSTFEALALSLDKQGYSSLPARVINNSLNLSDNYITLDKGKKDGVIPEMGVVSGNGIVGIVYMVSDHYSLAISLLNSKSSISCKFKNNEYFGYLKWKKGDSRYAFLEDLPLHALFQKGDTIVTSGYSAVFPRGIMTGTVDSISESKDGLSYLLRIQLATNFAALDDVLLISNKQREEQQALESSINKQP